MSTNQLATARDRTDRSTTTDSTAPAASTTDARSEHHGPLDRLPASTSEDRPDTPTVVESPTAHAPATFQHGNRDRLRNCFDRCNAVVVDLGTVDEE